MVDIKITDDILSITDCFALASDPACGGIASFVGTVRNHTKNKPVIRLEYECYESMARKEIQKIADKAISLFSVKNIVVHHRTGILFPGDAAIIIIVSDGHRNAVFDACSHIIENIKQTVPIWKKEIFENGEEWVSAHP
ncbi:molybdenum cofactor biosynthesis protein MoaE [Chryseobacterium lactis]|uniref:Molybdopterin synthase catalytic subunit n=1 Tax=Chryseobacterium lactis TaxID=1241981 RepID=A0A3G6RLH8_CHRLC|nr:molybdenum cofactor biosynthesis protein MoaE [Chryseobacterium lactis]AZA84355.1 molybdenum cofactor biosynthesis protein MoaE [Chryseobacterium lactis]AZB04743.1 molybdenum cofactor biosynthesis protein MoaE [Chryseobacterium lactis]PNW14835.1 molybdenum cofactor biosynthesis protein MoaE [Chryseobacterium lactis]